MVMVLLNLAAIPDEVAKSVDYTEVGWSKTFARAMEDYQSKFNERQPVTAVDGN